jgi:alpha-methylacyl-CoA racemase
MILADLGADVIRIDRPGGNALSGAPATDFLNRGRPSVALNLKDAAAVEVVLRLVAGADALVEGMRPGTAERLGIGPDECHAVNPRLVYGRMTGWGQDGPWSHAAGHDLNYIATAGALFGMGQDPARPNFPSNLVGDFGGGSTYLVIGVLAALLEARLSGAGQVVDAAIVDGTAHLNAMASGMLAGGGLQEQRGVNLLDGGLPYYDVYETADGRHLSVGALEPQFFAELVRLLELPPDAPGQADLDRYGELRAMIKDRIAQRTLAEWTDVFAGTDACAAPVLTLSEAAEHPHLAAREVFVTRGGAVQPGPAPRFSRTAASLTSPPAVPGQQTREALAVWGIDDVEDLIASGAAVQA